MRQKTQPFLKVSSTGSPPAGVCGGGGEDIRDRLPDDDDRVQSTSGSDFIAFVYMVTSGGAGKDIEVVDADMRVDA
jgi:hypothetical protein